MNENYTIINGELYHYGVPGMRWRHRKAGFAPTQKPRRPIGTMDRDGLSYKPKPPKGASDRDGLTHKPKSKSSVAKRLVQRQVFGRMGSRRIESLKSKGYSEKKAKGRVAVEQILTGLVASAAIVGGTALKIRRDLNK